jgi:hypothetical protein
LTGGVAASAIVAIFQRDPTLARRFEEELRGFGEVARGAYHLEYFSEEDLAGAIEIVGPYAGFRIGLANASNVVPANRHDTLDPLTLDERDFRALRGTAARPASCRPTPVGLL